MTLLSRLKSSLPFTLTAIVLGVIGVDRLLFHVAPAKASSYHAEVAHAVETMPTHVGLWLGADTAIPQAAVRLLHPNVIVSRRYQNVTTGRSVTLLLVQCRDARDLIGHYPPICYVNQGWTMESKAVADRPVDDLTLHTTRYRFTSGRLDHGSRIQIDNFMVLPDGQTAPDMQGIYAAARDPARKFFGAAQVQLVYDADLPANEIEDFSVSLIRSSRSIFDTIRAGVVNEP